MEREEAVEVPAGRGLGRLLASTSVSIAGQGMVLAAVPLLAARLTDDPFQVSLTVAATYAAWLVVGLPAGALVDRWPRRRTMVVADLVRALIIGGLGLAVVAGVAQIWLLILSVFLLGVASCFFDPAAQAAIPAVVGRDSKVLATANARIWSLDLMGRSLIGPPAGAALFVVAAGLPFVANAATFILSAMFLAGLGSLQPATARDGRPRLLASVKEGIHYLARHRELRTLTIGMASFNFVYNTANATFVLFAMDQLGVSEQGFGLLLASAAVGGLVAGYVVPKFKSKVSATNLYGVGLAVQGLGWLAVLAAPNPWVAAIAVAAVGGTSMAVTVLGAVARQRLTPDLMLGRVSATTRVAGIGSGALGALTGGLVASQLYIDAALWAAFITACLISVTLWMSKSAEH
ncbi:MFS transporter [Intrasporangium calvum]|uniref:Major facilitator superfamily MFS_1 n=1 Tax=Intrasporangium calvum (strain ATCC 23552 / DSM 43043 / JCM 3097 / NBRC 12989 / NCIMB 10167 / NRRL B-3866 / 7 KIP) TaxID=710696 RepID=E6SEI4_INTC7|nr:MFS transporter [Intrasporangium calvum]ADU46585.1 major facilitator superfamily MFS_1 [Intrasporangium calvum DSM 43043]